MLAALQSLRRSWQARAAFIGGVDASHAVRQLYNPDMTAPDPNSPETIEHTILFPACFPMPAKLIRPGKLTFILESRFSTDREPDPVSICECRLRLDADFFTGEFCGLLSKGGLAHFCDSVQRMLRKDPSPKPVRSARFAGLENSFRLTLSLRGSDWTFALRYDGYWQLPGPLLVKISGAPLERKSVEDLLTFLRIPLEAAEEKR
jgi:hypothetical protein